LWIPAVGEHVHADLCPVGRALDTAFECRGGVFRCNYGALPGDATSICVWRAGRRGGEPAHNIARVPLKERPLY
jgi:hypothetical protein